MEITLPISPVLVSLLLLALLFVTKLVILGSKAERRQRPPPRMAATVAVAPYGTRSLGIIRRAIRRLVVSNHHVTPWNLADLLRRSPTHTIRLHPPFMPELIVTAHPGNVEHVVKTRARVYPRGSFRGTILHDLLGSSLLNSDADGQNQRKLASPHFSSVSLRKFIDTTVKSEISGRLLPILSATADGKTVLDLQDVLKRFTFDTICGMTFGSDLGLLDPTFPNRRLIAAMHDAINLTSWRFVTFPPILWKMKRLFAIGKERQLRDAISIVDGLAEKIVRDRKASPEVPNKNADLLSAYMNCNDGDERFLKDVVIGFLLPGTFTTATALLWFFWLVSLHKEVEEEILRELSGRFEEEIAGFEQVKEMHYLHATFCESLRLYPPVSQDNKQAIENDVLPNGTVVKKGAIVMIVPYAMGRLESLYGKDWSEFRPGRWLRRDESTGRWQLLPIDPYKFNVFLAGPRMCLGKDMAFAEMKCIAASVLRRFRVAAATPEFQPVYHPGLTTRMKGGFPVKVEVRRG